MCASPKHGEFGRPLELALKAENDRLRAERDLLQTALLEAMRVLAKADPRGAAKWLRDQGHEA